MGKEDRKLVWATERGGEAELWEGSSVDPGSGWGVGSSGSRGRWPEHGQQSRTGHGNWWRGALFFSVVGLLRNGR